MLQRFAFNTAGNAQIWMIDLAGKQRVLMDYSHGSHAFQYDPERWKPEGMSDEEHAEVVESFKQSKSGEPT